jgi:hypothetical protein
MVAEEQPAAAPTAPVPPPPATKPAAGGGGPKLNKDGTERKKREPKKAKPASTAQHKQQPTKEQLDAQRNVMRETLKQLKEKRLGEGGDEEEEAPFEIESVYDLALGLELWLRDNSKVSARVDCYCSRVN